MFRARLRLPRPGAAIAAAAGLLLAAPPAAPAAELPLEPLAEPIDFLEVVEDFSEALADRLVGLSDEMALRKWEKVPPYFTAEFLGHLPERPGGSPEPLGWGIEERRADVATRPVGDRAAFLAAVRSIVDGYSRVDDVTFKVKAAEFEAARGLARLKVTVIGRLADGRPEELVSWWRCETLLEADDWNVHRLALESLVSRTAPVAFFDEVSQPAGVAYWGPRFGTPDNRSFLWNGAAAADLDGDGDTDLVVPSPAATFVYVNRGDGTFEERAAAVGLGDVRAGTAAVLFDADADGDPDLFLAAGGWVEDGRPGGTPLKLFENAGGVFTDVTARALGEIRLEAQTAAAGDADGDGDLDLYVCGYQRPEVVGPDSWYAATNGATNLLLVNEGGLRFRDGTAAAGVQDGRWSYACAWADFDEDGDQDLYVANDYAENALFVNDGTGRFVDRARELGVSDPGNGMGVLWADLDPDGDLDLYVANMSSTAGNRILGRMRDDTEAGVGATLVKLAAGNSLFLSDGEGGFTNATGDCGCVGAAWAWSPVVLDADLDGLPDLFVTNGFITGDSKKDT